MSEPAADASPLRNKIKIVCISDTHLKCPSVPDADLLVHAGDLSNWGKFSELQPQLDWLGALPHAHKLVIGGNHDRGLDPAYLAEHPKFEQGERVDLNWHDLTYLCNSSVTISFPHLGRTLTVYGSPKTPAYEPPKGGPPQYYTWAFQYRGAEDVWANTVPEGTELLLVHGPPRGHLDDGGKGCPHLLREVWRARPPLVVFGHMHDGRGVETLRFDGWEAWTRDQINMRSRERVKVSSVVAGAIRMRARVGQVLGREVEGGKGRTEAQLVNAAHDPNSDPIVVYL